jgi:hypothetical protein
MPLFFVPVFEADVAKGFLVKVDGYGLIFPLFGWAFGIFYQVVSSAKVDISGIETDCTAVVGLDQGTGNDIHQRMLRDELLTLAASGEVTRILYG